MYYGGSYSHAGKWPHTMIAFDTQAKHAVENFNVPSANYLYIYNLMGAYLLLSIQFP